MGIKKIYVAAPLFSEADRFYNEMITKQIEELGFTCYLPQRNAEINNKENFANAVQIYQGDTNELRDSDILVCFLDGPVVDPGVAAEIGWFAHEAETRPVSEKTIIGLITDSREGMYTTSETTLQKKVESLHTSPGESQFNYINLYVTGAVKLCGKLCSSVNEMLSELKSLK